MRQAANIDSLRPGVTGLAQIHGRDDLDLKDKVSYDRTYLETCSLRLDLAIMVQTFTAVVSSRGSN
jgi:O-antigen biosynthesis protein WbqP